MQPEKLQDFVTVFHCLKCRLLSLGVVVFFIKHDETEEILVILRLILLF